MRPTYEMGQPGYVDGKMPHRDTCRTCHGPMDMEDYANGRRFCCDHCAMVARQRDESRYLRIQMQARHAVYNRLHNQRAHDAKTCPICGNRFFPDRYHGQDYCSPECASKARRTIDPRPCRQCGTVFTPANDRVHLCSRACANAAKSTTKYDHVCRQCGTAFTSHSLKSVYCSKRCSSAFYAARDKAMTGAAAFLRLQAKLRRRGNCNREM